MDPVARVFESWQQRTHAPGLAWGVVRDGELVASGGFGTLRVGDASVPDADSIFRIASMTKSFTGAAVMSLVVEGRLRLDDPIETWIPEAAAWRGADEPPLTVGHLVTMSSGLPTDDAWADRHLDMSEPQMDALLAAGPQRAWPAGIGFEYANLGWGLLGRIVRRLTGEPVQTLVSERILGPLGMRDTTWLPPADDTRTAYGHRWEDETWKLEPAPLLDGAIAPMGGLWTSVRDLATWVGFHLDAWPARDEPGDGPLPRWARRHQQQMFRFAELVAARPDPAGPSRLTAVGYGIGLGVLVDRELGTVIGHSGGLPGYGSHMRWIPDRGIGVIALSNVTYGWMDAACAEALEVLARTEPVRHVTQASSGLTDACEQVVGFLNDPADPAGFFADNVEPDEALERRRAAGARLRDRYGDLAVESIEPATPMRGALVTAGGLVRIDIELNHEGKVQLVEIDDAGAPSDAPILPPRAAADHPRSAYAVVRPTGELARACLTWQGELLDRLRGAECTPPRAHATLKAFGSSATPIDDDDERRIVDVLRAWAEATGSIELVADGFDILEDDQERIVVLRLKPGPIIPAMASLREACEAAGLPAGDSDRIAVDDWTPHISLAYVKRADDLAWSDVQGWVANTPTGGHVSVAAEVEVVAFGAGAERRLARIPFTR